VARFTYNDIVIAMPLSNPKLRPGQKAWIVGIDDRQVFPRREFPPGVVYQIEFEDRDSVEAHEADLLLVEAAPTNK